MKDPSIHDRLEAIAARIQPRVVERRVVDAVGPAFVSSAPFLLAAPLLYALAQLLRLAGGGPPTPVSPQLLAAATVIPAALLFALRLVWVQMQPVDLKEAIQIADDSIDADERLLTALEFSSRKNLGPFELAALQDARPHLERAIRAPLAVERVSIHVDSTVAKPLVSAAILLPLSMWLGTYQPVSIAHDVDSETTEAFAPVTLASDPPRADRTAVTPPPPLDPTSPPREEHRPDPTATATSFASGLSDRVKESEGKTGAGQSSNAESISGQSDSRGVPSNQSQATKSAAENKVGDKKPKKKPDSESPRSEERKESEETSGATAGRGSSRGSNKNPASTDWASKDQVTTADDAAIESDEEIEDESEDSRARGGVQPSLRDRRPPVSRDLQIGFGNANSEDANGRGGPSARKKSRGTASLVLGVPIPDRVKGQPNPGKTKITQERVQPKQEEAPLQVASARASRDARVGHVAQPDLPQWMQRLVRDYFLTLRSREIGEP